MRLNADEFVYHSLFKSCRIITSFTGGAKGVVIEVEIYEDIRKLAIEGMSQRAIAKKLGISRQTVKKYGEGETIPGNRTS